MKKQQQKLLIGAILFIFLIGVGIFAYIISQDDRVYKKVPSKYCYEDENLWQAITRIISGGVKDQCHMDYFREIQAQAPDGYIDNPQYWEDRGYWFITGLLTNYENRQEKRDIDDAVRLLKKMEARCQGDTDGDGWKDCKSFYVYDGIDRTHGYIGDVFSRAIYIIHKYKVTEYDTDAVRWAKLIDENWLPYYKKYFKEYDVNGVKMGVYINNNYALHFNRVAPWGTTFIWRWLDTGNEEYKKYPQEVLNRFFDEQVNPRRTYNGITYITPKYAWGDNRSGELSYCGPQFTAWNKEFMCTGTTDASHLNYEFELIETGYEKGLVSLENRNLMQNTIRVMMLDNAKVGDRSTSVIYQSAEPPRLPFADEVNSHNIFRQTGHMYNFIRFGMDDSAMVYKFEDILHQLEISGKLNGNYYTSYFQCVKDPRLIEGQSYLNFCSNDGEERVENMEIFYAIANLGRYQ